MRLTAALAMLSVGPAILIIETQSAARAVSLELPAQEQQFKEAIAQLGRRKLSCTSTRSNVAYLTSTETKGFFGTALAATSRLNAPHNSDYPFWTYKKWLPYTAGLYSVCQTTGAATDYLQILLYHYDFCRDIQGGDDTDFHQEELRSQVRLNGHLTKLREFDHGLAAARALFAEDGPKLAALAWSLGILQVVGWGLLYFVIFPQQVRAWRKKRAEKKAAEASTR